MTHFQIYTECEKCGDYSTHLRNFNESRNIAGLGKCKAKYIDNANSWRTCSNEGTRVIVAVSQSFETRPEWQYENKGYLVAVCDDCPRSHPFGIQGGIKQNASRWCPAAK